MLFRITLIALIGCISAQESIVTQKCDEFYPNRGDRLGGLLEVPRQGHIDAEQNEFPFIAAVGFEDDTGDFKYGCTGVLIDPKYVLCPAYCVKPIRPEGKTIIVYVGNIDISNPKALSGGIAANRTFVHPEYKAPKVYNQIAMIELKKSVSERPACLWNGDVDFMRHNLLAYERDTRKLYRTSASVVSNDECSYLKLSSRKLPDGIPDSLICVQEENQIDCQPSVGPLIAQKMEDIVKLPYVVGIQNVGQGCGKKPGLFSKMPAYVDWVASTIWPNA